MMRSEDSAMRVWDLEPRDGLKLAAILMATALINLPEHPRRLDVRLQAQIVNPALRSWTGFGKSFIYDSWWFRNPATLPQSSLLSSARGSVVRAELHDTGRSSHRLAPRKKSRSNWSASCFPSGSRNCSVVSTAIGLLTPAIPEPLCTTFELGALCCLIQRKPGPGLSRGMMFAMIPTTRIGT
jgi:hypothetical protein